jgi:hypothetical protein
MKPFVPVLVIGVAMSAFMTTQVVKEGRSRATTQSGELTMDDEHPSPRNFEQIRRRIREGAASTYINEILEERDSSLARWPERPDNPPRVWIGNGDDLMDWDSTHLRRVRDAFDEWALVGIPVRFSFATDSAHADVHVTWIDHFTGPMHGQTTWTRDEDWWIVNGTITIALHRNTGEELGGSAITAIALHEVGHLLGLVHTMDTTSIMAPHVRVYSLSAADRATLSLLYSLPAGSLVEKKSPRWRRLVAIIPAYLKPLF